jgi:hypothetical protein
MFKLLIVTPSGNRIKSNDLFKKIFLQWAKKIDCCVGLRNSLTDYCTVVIYDPVY